MRYSMLSIQFTDEMKAFAILLIFLTHSHLSETLPFLTYGNYGNAVFLILSGYGLYASSRLKPVPWMEFLSKRVRRVLEPAAVFVSLILVLWVQSPQLAAALHGFHVIVLDAWIFLYQTIFTTHLWFIPYIFVWYLAYAVVSHLSPRPPIKILLLFFLSFLFTMATSAFMEVYLWAMFAFCFPFGVLLGLVQERLLPLVGKNPLPSSAVFLALIALSLLVNREISYVYFLFGVRFAVPYYAFTSLFTGIGLLGLGQLIFIRFARRPLAFLENRAYEYYLVHLHAIGIAWLLLPNPILSTILAAFLAYLMAGWLRDLVAILFRQKSEKTGTAPAAPAPLPAPASAPEPHAPITP
ncbi:MAG: acyltransferase family protein [Candidatus Marsarchaeota archaeon]|nr:acyltransferase family protein [Candidatus Marsarchaeota archaeon]